jgi:hypothetical protein
MNKKITTVGFFVSIILLAQVMVPPVMAPPIDEDFKITISTDDLQKIEDAIDNLKDSTLYEPLKSIFYDNVTYCKDSDEVELNLIGIRGILQYLADHLDDLGDITNSLVYDINGLIMAIIEIIIIYIVAIPFIALELIIMDLERAITEFSNNIIAHLGDIITGGLITGIAALITDINELIEKIKEIIPSSAEDLKEYLVRAAGVALQSMIVSIGRTILENYVKPRFGYISITADYIVNACTYTTQLVDDLNMKIPWIKSIFVELPEALVEFFKPEGLIVKISLLDDLATAIYNAYLAAQGLLSTYGSTYEKITIIIDNIVGLYDYYNGATKPWEEPIIVTGKIMNFDSDVVVSFVDPDQADAVTVSPGSNGLYQLEYITTYKENPMAMHQFNVSANCESSTKTQKDWGFSHGVANVSFDFRKAKVRSEPSSRIQILGARLESLFENLKILFRHFALGIDLIKDFQRSYTPTMC